MNERPMQSNHHIKNTYSATRPGRSWRRADRDLLCQIVCIRHMAADLAQTDVRPEPKRQLFAAVDMKSRLDWARQLRGEAQRMVRAQLDHANSLGAWRRVTQAPLPAALEGCTSAFRTSAR